MPLPYQVNVNDVLVVGSSIVAALLAARGRGRSGSVRVEGVRVESLVSGYPGTPLEWRRVRLPGEVMPEGYEGEWLVALLGCGGNGCAYLARRDRTGERVVFKVPRRFREIVESGTVPTGVGAVADTYLREAEVASKLSHPHVLRLLAYSRVVPLLVYEHADGGNLRWQIGRGWRPKLRDVVLIGAQLASALRYIHSRGVVHGDVRPENVMVVSKVVKLGDFSSVTRLLRDDVGAGEVTAGWAAPEQYSEELDREAREKGFENRRDVYMLGNLILYMLTEKTVDGRLASDREEVLKRVREVGDKYLRELLLEMLRYEPWERPSSEEVYRRLVEIYRSLK